MLTLFLALPFLCPLNRGCDQLFLPSRVDEPTSPNTFYASFNTTVWECTGTPSWPTVCSAHPEYGVLVQRCNSDRNACESTTSHEYRTVSFTVPGQTITASLLHSTPSTLETNATTVVPAANCDPGQWCDGVYAWTCERIYQYSQNTIVISPSPLDCPSGTAFDPERLHTLPDANQTSTLQLVLDPISLPQLFARTHSTKVQRLLERLPCPAGHVCRYDTGIIRWTRCPQGTYCNSTAYTLFDEPVAPLCPLDHRCPDGITAIPCPFTFAPGATSCDSCALYHLWDATVRTCRHWFDVVPCPSGFFCNAFNTSTACSSGSWCAANSTSEQDCPSGYYCATPSTPPLECTPGQYCAPRSTSASLCPAGFFCASPSTRDPCPSGALCPEGSVQPTPCSVGFACPNATTSVVCPPGTSCSSPGRSVPLLCDAGFYCLGGANVPTPCGMGTLCNVSSLPYASPCPAGYYCASPLNATLCPQDYFCPEGVGSPLPCTPVIHECKPGSAAPVSLSWFCEQGFYCPTWNTSIACSIGSYCPYNVTSEMDCPAGYTCPTPDRIGACSLGSFCPVRSFLEVDCGLGFVCANTSTRVACEPGEVCTSPRQTVHELCAQGWECGDPTRPHRCADGETSFSRGATACTPCDQLAIHCANGTVTPFTGTWITSLSRYGAPSLCPRGFTTYSPQFTTCHACLPGFAELGDGYCTRCDPLLVAPNYGSTRCSQCGSGSVAFRVWRNASSNEWLSDCVSCALFGAGTSRSGFCIPCAPGTIPDVNTAVPLLPASWLADPRPNSLGAYDSSFFAQTPVAIPSRCRDCDNSSVATGYGSATCTLCPLGTFGNRTVCLDCPPGRYGSTRGMCSLCPSGRYGAGVALTSANCTGACPLRTYCGQGATSPQWCPLGYYCPSPLTKLECPRGTYGNTTGLVTAQCSGNCSASEVCPGATITPEACPVGYFCSNHTKTACSRGTYNPNPGASDASACLSCPEGTFGYHVGLSTPTCSGVCPDGILCPAGAVSATEFCPRGYWCKRGKATPCAPGSFANRVGQVECSACPAGVFGNTSGATSSLCDGLCPRGFFCPKATTIPIACNANTTVLAYCPVGSSFPTAASPGFFVDESDASRQQPCPTGSFCSPWATRGRAQPCDSGTVQPLEAQLECVVCTNASLYCPQGSSVAQPVSPGFEAVASSLYRFNASSFTYTLVSVFVSQQACPENYYCQKGVKRACTENGVSLGYCPQGTAVPSACPLGSYCVGDQIVPCPAGTYQNVTGQTSPLCSGECALHEYCPQGTVSPVLCPRGFWCNGRSRFECSAGTYQNATGQTSSLCEGVCDTASYCPPASALPQPCPERVLCDGTGRLSPCPRGFSCSQSVARRCPTGFVGKDGECTPCSPGTYAFSLDQCAVCPRGFRCANATASPTQCTTPGYYCPEGSSLDLHMPSGSVALYDAVFGKPAIWGYAPCPASSYCIALLSLDALPCADGFEQPFQGQTECVPCEEDRNGTEYCSQGRRLPVGKQRLVHSFVSWRSKTIVVASRVLPCPSGFVCANGVAQACPAGTVANERCETCPDGFVCPSGVAERCSAGQVPLNRTHCVPCAAGTYGNGTTCPSGFYCPQGAVRPIECVRFVHLCPPASATPLVIARGWYWVSFNESLPCPVGHACNSRSSVPVPCAAGTFANQTGMERCTPCEAGTVQPTTGASRCDLCSPGKVSASASSVVCTPCVAGTFCNESGGRVCSTCPAGTYSLPGATGCVDCPAGTYSSEASAACRVCPLGSYQDAKASSSCTVCPLGKIGDYVGVTECRVCDASRGKYAPTAGLSSCLDCMFQVNANASECAIYPCSAGYRVTKSGCEACPVGKYSPANSAECYSCPQNTYSMSVASATCLSCSASDGLQCEEVTGYAKVKAGHWMSLATLKAHACPDRLCPGGVYLHALVANETQCAVGRDESANNVLCGACREGFLEWNDECVPCTKTADGAIASSVVFTIAVVFCIHQLSQNPSDPTLAILIFFFQAGRSSLGPFTDWLVAMRVFDMSPMQDWFGVRSSSRDTLQERLAQQCLAPLSLAEQLYLVLFSFYLFLLFLLVSLAVNAVLSSFFPQWRWKHVVNWAFEGINRALEYIVFVWVKYRYTKEVRSTQDDGFGQMDDAWLELEAMEEARRKSSSAAMVNQLVAGWVVRAWSDTIQQRLSSLKQDATAAMVLFLAAQQAMRSQFSWRALGTLYRDSAVRLAPRYMRTAVNLYQITFVPVLRTAIQLMMCTSVDNHHVVYFYPTLSCGSSSYKGLVSVGTLLVVFHCIGLPALWVRWFVNARRSSVDKDLLTQAYRVGLDGLVLPYRDGCFYWSIVVLARQFLFIGVVELVILSFPVRNLILAFLHLTFLALVAAARPFPSPNANQIELSSSVGLIILSVTSSGYPPPYADDVAAWITFVFLAGMSLILGSMLAMRYALWKSKRDWLASTH